MNRLILNSGANPNKPDRFGRTPLMQIFMGSYDEIQYIFDIIKLLIDHGADPNIPDNMNEIPYIIMERDLGYHLDEEQYQELLNILNNEQPKDPGYW
jgi:ankyrin repeat protein